MRILTLIILTVVIIGCRYFSPGTLGSFQQWALPTSKEKLDSSLVNLYQNHPEYLIPNKWKELDDWDERGYNFLHGKIVYFKDKPEEMYFFSYTDIEPNSPGNDNDFTIATIFVRAVNAGDGEWHLADYYERNKLEENRINARFYKEIIFKLEKQMKLKGEKY